MKKTIALILTVVMLSLCIPTVFVSAEPNEEISVYSGEPDVSWYTDEVKEAQAYTLKSAEELAGLSKLAKDGQTFEGFKITLGVDVVFNPGWTKEQFDAYAKSTTDPKTLPEGKGEAPYVWTPIGTGTTFKGVFDGNSHTVSGLYNASGTHNVGMFGKFSTGAIQYLVIKDSYFIGNKNVGGLVGCVEGSGVAITGIYVDAWVENNTVLPADTPAANKFSGGGGIVGYIYTDDVSIKDCVFFGKVTANDARVGGIAGGFNRGRTNITFKNCANYGTIVATQKIGGITSVIQASTDVVFDTCLSAGVLSGKEVGSISGYTWAADGHVSGKVTYKDCMYVADQCNKAAFINGNEKVVVGTHIQWVFQKTKGDGTIENIPGTLENIKNAATPILTLESLKGSKENLTPAFASWYVDEEVVYPIPEGAAVALGKGSIKPIRAVSSQTSQITDGKYNIRFIATLDKMEYEEYGFEISYTLPGATEPTVVKKAEKVAYTEVYAVDSEFNILTKRAADHSANYLYGTIISDVVADGTVVYTVKPYTKEVGAEVVYGVGYTVTYNNGVFASAKPLA